MKLILCRDCQDVFKLSFEKRECECGKCWGFYYPDGLYALYGGENAIPIGFANDSLVEAIRNQPEIGKGKEFTAFVIPRFCVTMEKVS